MAESSAQGLNVRTEAHLIQVNAKSNHMQQLAAVLLFGQLTHLVWSYDDFLPNTFVLSVRFLCSEGARPLVA